MATIDDGSKNAASKLRDQCNEKGMHASIMLHVPVVGWTGPLAPEGQQMAKEFAHRFLASLE